MPRTLSFSHFCLLHAIALTLILSWLLPITGWLWAAFDIKMVEWLNGSLTKRPVWQAFWAIANHKAVDLVLALILIGISIIWWRTGDQLEKPERGHSLRFLGVGFVVGYLFCKIGTSKVLGLLAFYRMSPSMVLDHFFSLPDAVPWIYVKAKSTTSFPGDHSCVFLLWALLFGHFAKGWWAFFSLLIAGFGVLPRLMGATHWATDVLVGSGSLLCVTLAWILASPLSSWLELKTKPRLFHGNENLS